jgi:hypothetical protein
MVDPSQLERSAGGRMGAVDRPLRTFTVRGLLGVAAALLALAACGGSPAGSPAAGGTTSAAGPSEAGTAGPRQSTVDESGAGSSSAVPPGSPAAVESNPPGDIPDTVAYVPWTSPDHRVTVTHPEGWAERSVPGGARFTDKLNSVTITVRPGALPSPAQARADAAKLADPGRAFELRSVASARLPAGAAVVVTWRENSARDPVTGKVYRDEVVTYLLGRRGRLVRLDLSGPVGSDNVDPYRTMSQSLRLA